MRIACAWMLALLAALPLAAPPARAAAQQGSSRETERKLEKIKTELKSVAAERRKLEGQRGDAAQKLRAADEQVGRSNRVLRDTETRLAREHAALKQTQDQRDSLKKNLGARRKELEQLLRAAYAQGNDAPLKALLSQDRVADSGRILTYHGYLQRDRARRIDELTAQLRELDRLEREIVERRASLDSTRKQQRAQLGQLEKDRKDRAVLVAQINEKYEDRSTRERELGRDAKGLEQLLAKLRAAAARAEAQRRAAAKARAEREAREARAAAAAAAKGKPAPVRKPPVAVASAPAPQVGGLGWPVSGALLAGFGGTMPDGRSSEGLLIGAPAGATVKAVGDGTVVYSEWMTGYGLLLIVDHGNGYMSLYANNDALLKDAGATVKKGDAVATVGSSGGHGRPALYFELRRGGQPVNPGVWLRR
ncbi:MULTISPECIES: murein hydrolase activator EnvC family protein [Lysobacter]|uniref:Peptidase, family M23/M37 domain protein n=1 Tax=Lysobacter enzymogenes TaxID=69 RepID=A0A0S2DB02_LYSEN|nr:peptidoglycan DD-metalloendopeptidase family protein [Lysobacter enzymogenes]ALN55631.1 peptidase, family M23/M37 domain protein [Lysobacter enzymogenes]QQQ01092.1 peptidoglycan DD-metalloendopeptidase family protein [Lysobacter enzymogenes]UZW60364.1 peptidoglycan DD-metalloendopeptidase family protein [Lysobacter enzymogenes]